MLNLLFALLIILLVILLLAVCAYYRTLLNKRNKSIDKYREMWIAASERANKNNVDAICWRAAIHLGIIGNKK